MTRTTGGGLLGDFVSAGPSLGVLACAVFMVHKAAVICRTVSSARVDWHIVCKTNKQINKNPKNHRHQLPGTGFICQKLKFQKPASPVSSSLAKL